MCGILGSIDLYINERNVAELNHRGPDGQGLEKLRCAEHDIWLAHKRLSIQDLTLAGHQPMRSKDARWCIVFNGEIYNHIDLRKTLKGSFHGHSDTETLVEMISQKGIEATLPQLNGMFAFAALDIQESKIYLARDPFGIKPLYYSKRKEGFAFSSEVRALNSVFQNQNSTPNTISNNGLQQFLTLRYTPSPTTIWQDVERLAPGEIMEFDIAMGTIKVHPYIAPTTIHFQGTIEDAVEQYHDMLSAAVKRQFLADVPVGILLSGGIDSALIAAMAKSHGYEPPCFTVGFGGQHPECEISDAANTANILNLPFHEVHINADLIKGILPQIARSIEEPLGTTSVMAMWPLVQRARIDTTVVLTGQGVDEPWGGYNRYRVALLRDKLPFPNFWKIAKFIAKGWFRKPEMVERGLRSLSESLPINQIIEANSLFTTAERHELTGNEFDGGASKRLDEWLNWLMPASLSDADRMMRLDSRTNLADDLLLYGDKISMAASLEARVPMLDIDLIQFVESLPIDFRLNYKKNKIVHRLMSEKYLPNEIILRRKKGFQVPFSQWSRNEWKNWLEELLYDGLDGLIRKNAIEKLWKQHLNSAPDRSRQIFALIMLALWRREHLRG